MNLVRLEVFTTVCAAGSFTRAAEHLAMTKSAASQLRISANVTADFGIVTGLRSVLGCAEKIVGMRSS